MNLHPLLLALNLKARIAFFTVVLFTAAIWLLAHDLDEEVRDNFRDVLAAQQLYTVEHIASSLDEAVKLRLNALVDAASLIDPLWMGHGDRLHGFLANQMPLHRFFNTGLVVVSREGLGLADWPPLEGREGASFTNMAFFREVMASGRPAIGKPIQGRFTRQPVINFAAPIKDRDGVVIGALVGGNLLAGSDLLSEIVPRELRMRGDLHVISPRDGLFVASTDPSRVLQPTSAKGVNLLIDRFKEGYEGSGVSVNSRGVENLSSGKRVASTGWLVVASLPTAIAFEPLLALQRGIYKDAALASLLIALFLWWYLHRELSP